MSQAADQDHRADKDQASSTLPVSSLPTNYSQQPTGATAGKESEKQDTYDSQHGAQSSCPTYVSSLTTSLAEGGAVGAGSVQEEKTTSTYKDQYLQFSPTKGRSKKSNCSSARSSLASSRILIKKSEVAALKLKQQAQPDLNLFERAELELQRKIEEEEMLMEAELKRLEAQQKAEEAQKQAERRAEEIRLKIEKTRRLNEMKDRLTRMKMETEQAKLQVEIEAAEAAAAVLESGSDVDEDSSVLASLTKLDRTKDLFLNRPDPASQQREKVEDKIEASQREFHHMHQQADLGQPPRETKTKLDSQQDQRVDFRLSREPSCSLSLHSRSHRFGDMTSSGQTDQRLNSQAPPFVPAGGVMINHPHEHSKQGASGLDASSSLPRSSQGLSESQVLVRSLAEALSVSRLPVPKPTVFKGDPLDYPAWIAAFKHLVRSEAVRPEDKMLILREHLDGPARQAVGNLYYELSESSYIRALEILKDRFGEDHSVAESLKTRLETWPDVKPNDYHSLMSFVDYLRQCQALSMKIVGLGIMQDPSYINKLVQKIPRPLAHMWSRKVESAKRATGVYPSFEAFVEFLHFESSALRHVPAVKARNQDSSSNSRSSNTYLTASAPDAVQDNNTSGSDPQSQRRIPTCHYCKETHYVSECRKLTAASYQERKEFATKAQLCFKCLRPSHIARDCKVTLSCKECRGNHLTSMHDPDFRPNRAPTNF